MIKNYCRYIINKDAEINYIEFVPCKTTKNMPLLLYLHGIGERGNSIKDIEKYALPKYMNQFDIPYIVIAPQCTNNNFWDYHLRDIEEILKEVYKKYSYDKKRVCILGGSMGAYGAWNYIISRPNIFKGIVSVSGGIMLPIEQNLLPLKNKAILIYHGSNDDVINVNESVMAYDKLKSFGATNVELQIINNDNHFLTSHAFKDKYLYEWLKKNI